MLLIEITIPICHRNKSVLAYPRWGYQRQRKKSYHDQTAGQRTDENRELLLDAKAVESVEEQLKILVEWPVDGISVDMCLSAKITYGCLLSDNLAATSP